ncbi:MAG: hypothetical protein EZS28_053213, partial [Streblomastix strix]
KEREWDKEKQILLAQNQIQDKQQDISTNNRVILTQEQLQQQITEASERGRKEGIESTETQLSTTFASKLAKIEEANEEFLKYERQANFKQIQDMKARYDQDIEMLRQKSISLLKEKDLFISELRHRLSITDTNERENNSITDYERLKQGKGNASDKKRNDKEKEKKKEKDQKQQILERETSSYQPYTGISSPLSISLQPESITSLSSSSSIIPQQPDPTPYQLSRSNTPNPLTPTPDKTIIGHHSRSQSQHLQSPHPSPPLQQTSAQS